jgi:glucokinase
VTATDHATQVRCVGIDIGGTSTKAAMLDGDGAVLCSRALPTLHGAAGIIATAIEAIEAIVAAGVAELADISVVGLGIPGAVDPVAGTVRHAVNVGIGPEPVELADALARHFGRRVHIENDVKAAALGAHFFISAADPSVDLAYLSVGTGIAAGFVQGGRLRRGSSLVAGEIGHIPIDPAGPLCACGQTGCIEAISSGSAIEREWPSTNGSPARALAAAAVEGDPLAEIVWRRVVGGLSSAVQLLALTMDPDFIVLSGGVAELGELLRTAIIDRLSDDQRSSEFLRSLDLGRRIRIIDPSVMLGPIGAVRAAAEAGAQGVTRTMRGC